MTVTATSTRAVVLARRPAAALSPEDLELRELPLPPLRPGEALVRNTFMSLDPSTRGRMDASEKVYTDSFDLGAALDGWAVGDVVDSRSPLLPVGSTVRHRLGWRELAVVTADSARVVEVTRAPAPAWLSCLGQTGFTAYVGLVRAGLLRAGDTVLVSAAAGGVGSIAGQIARLLGAGRVIGTAGTQAKCDWLVNELGYDAAVVHHGGGLRHDDDLRHGAVGHHGDDLVRRLREVAPTGVDLYFDNVGGPQLAAALRVMSVGGRVALCGSMSTMTSGRAQPPLGELLQAILRRLTLRGFIVRDHEELRPEFEDRMLRWLSTGELVDGYHVVDGLPSAPEALVGLLAGSNTGKALVRLS